MTISPYHEGFLACVQRKNGNYHWYAASDLTELMLVVADQGLLDDTGKAAKLLKISEVI